MAQLVEEAYAAGGIPYVNLKEPKVERALAMGYTDQQLDWLASGDGQRMRECQAYIGVRAGDNSYETGDVPQERMRLYAQHYGNVVHGGIRVPNTKWVVLRYPVPAMAQQACMSTEAFEDYYFDVCCLDYGKMARAMEKLVSRMKRTDKVRIVGQGTDLSFSIKGMNVVPCAGECNIPDGEVYTAPLRESVNGVIRYNTPRCIRALPLKHHAAL